MEDGRTLPPALKGEIRLRWEMRPSPLPISALQARPSVLRASSQCPPFILPDSRITQALAISGSTCSSADAETSPQIWNAPEPLAHWTF